MRHIAAFWLPWISRRYRFRRSAWQGNGAPKADLVLLHAFELPYEGKLRLAGVEEQELEQYVTSSSKTRRKRLHDLAATAGLAPAEYRGRVIHGDPAQQIVAVEQELSSDLVVIGKHGSHVVEELLLGSVTKQVLAESQCDVLVICDPREAPHESP
jgi:nucleotide-binding universal stress UspA family protein